jgi:hypothetical protein
VSTEQQPGPSVKRVVQLVLAQPDTWVGEVLEQATGERRPEPATGWTPTCVTGYSIDVHRVDFWALIESVVDDGELFQELIPAPMSSMIQGQYTDFLANALTAGYDQQPQWFDQDTRRATTDWVVVHAPSLDEARKLVRERRPPSAPGPDGNAIVS